MSEQFQPGDLVECVTVGPVTAPDAGRMDTIPGLEVGGVYTVVRVWPWGDDRVCSLKETTARTLSRGFNTRRFRKLYTPDPKFIERLTAEPVIMPPVRQPGKVDA